MSIIHVKEAILKGLPSISHPLTPHLFVEAGIMSCHRKTKSKSAIIYINLCGVYLFRPIAFSKKYKISQFFSTYDICEIEYKDIKEFVISTKAHSLIIQCEHYNEAIST